MENKNQDISKTLSFDSAIRSLDIFFIRSKERELYKFVLRAVERPLIETVLEKTYGNKIKAAKILGINRNTLHAKIKKLGIEVNKWRLT